MFSQTNKTQLIAICLSLNLIFWTNFLMADCFCNYTEVKVTKVTDEGVLLIKQSGQIKKLTLHNLVMPRVVNPKNDSKWCEAESRAAVAAKLFIENVLSKASSITIDEKETEPQGDLKAIVYFDNISLNKELKYKYLAYDIGETTKWCQP